MMVSIRIIWTMMLKLTMPTMSVMMMMIMMSVLVMVVMRSDEDENDAWCVW